MTLTREQLKKMSDLELDEVVPKVAGWREDDHPEVNGTGPWMVEYEYPVYYKQDGTMIESFGYYPTEDINQTLELESEVIELDVDLYIRELASLLGIDGYPFNRNIVAKMLQATPRQRTIAAILTLQGGD
ncbi:hypothetical protein NDS46_31625 (plasmid) [Paenibacillus thiaminolyticus]|uniref:hypothetical protein n=1 Tax=Paenibacillus thiaminolyticus TaxID=49283 RepID=UPI00232F9834|nr:hypothetical protein [Paenibacillus thiaminolyticus]WCF11509.1 hypothetical protein NDS46_31625 [Paenibacillus thiaminolyticus]